MIGGYRGSDQSHIAMRHTDKDGTLARWGNPRLEPVWRVVGGEIGGAMTRNFDSARIIL